MTRALAVFILLAAMRVAADAEPLHGIVPTEDSRLVLPGARFRDLGAQVEVNGLRTSVKFFSASELPEEVSAWYSQSLGEPLSSRQVGSRRMQMHVIQDRLVTVSIVPAPGGSRGTVATVLLRGLGARSAAVAKTAWSSFMPSDTRLILHTVSRDGAQRGQQWVLGNRAGPAVNRESLIHSMRELGLSPEREALGRPPGRAEGRVMFFSGAASRALVSVQVGLNGESLIVVTLVSREGS